MGTRKQNEEQPARARQAKSAVNPKVGAAQVVRAPVTLESIALFLWDCAETAVNEHQEMWYEEAADIISRLADPPRKQHGKI